MARKINLDPELALREASGRFSARVEAAIGLAKESGSDWSDLSPEQQQAFYRRSEAMLQSTGSVSIEE